MKSLQARWSSVTGSPLGLRGDADTDRSEDALEQENLGISWPVHKRSCVTWMSTYLFEFFFIRRTDTACILLDQTSYQAFNYRFFGSQWLECLLLLDLWKRWMSQFLKEKGY
jgi:hypothetical protein